jgi:hypothetical protein
MRFNILTAIYYFIVVILAAISGILSYYGVKLLLGDFAIPFAVVISLSLIAANIVIQRDRRNGHGPLPGLLMLTLAASLSFLSNFNVVYTNQMRKDVAQEAVSESYELFRGNLTRAKSVLAGSSQVELERRQLASFNAELQNLRAQILDPENRGVGPLAEVHMDKIEGMLGAPLTSLRPPPSSAPDPELIAWFNRYSTLAREAFQTKAGAGSAAELNDVLGLIDKNLDQFEPPSDAQGQDLSLLREYATRSQEVIRQANALLPGEEQVKLIEIDFLDGRLGELMYTLRNGFVERPNPSATYFSSFIAAFVDLFPVCFAFLAFRVPIRGGEQEIHERPRAHSVRSRPGGLT